VTSFNCDGSKYCSKFFAIPPFIYEPCVKSGSQAIKREKEAKSGEYGVCSRYRLRADVYSPLHPYFSPRFPVSPFEHRCELSAIGYRLLTAKCHSHFPFSIPDFHFPGLFASKMQRYQKRKG